MKKIGIIGGLSPESTVTYYQWLNDGVRQRLGGHHSAPLLISSVDFGVFVALKEQGDWDTQARLLAGEASALEKAGADLILLATNTMHKLAPEIEAAVTVPLLHIADATADRISAQRLTTVGLLGTRYTMEQDFYTGRLEARGVKVLIPDENGRRIVNDIIYNELCHGVIEPRSRAAYRAVMDGLVRAGAQGIIMGCTEITLLIDRNDCAVPLFDTTRIHVERALEAIFA